eukprot:Skav206345  [mRNA]  locus=scaffold3448:16189:18383:+ [translate_table: standard]
MSLSAASTSPQDLGTVAELRAELAAVRAEVAVLRTRVEKLERERDSDFEVVQPATASQPASSTARRELSYERVCTAENIGYWVVRCLNSDYRGPSGRDRISLPSRWYLVFRDVEFKTYNPPLLFPTWKEAKPYCSAASTGSFQQSVFVGEEEKSSESEEELFEQHLRAHFVLPGEDINFDYHLGVLLFSPPTKTCGVIAVAEVDSKVLVAVPDTAWARKKKSRSIPEDALQRATRVSVQSCQSQRRDTPLGEPDLALWLGLLDPQYEVLASYDGGEDSMADKYFPLDSNGVQKLPYAASLVAVARDHFTFLSAESTARGPGEGNLGQSDAARISVLEATLGDLVKKIDALASSQRPAAAPKKTARKPAPAASAPTPAGVPPGLDPALVQQALSSGVSPEALQEMGSFLQKSGSVLPPNRLAIPAEVQSSSEEEADQVVGGDGSGSQDPVAQAVVQLTKLVQGMRKDKSQRRSGIDDILDKAEFGSQKEPGTSSRSKAAALRSLRTLLTQNPKLLHQSLERRMQEDWDTVQAMPGVAASSISARGWVEHRSKIQSYSTSVRFSWILAGIWDALRCGRVDEARARAGLGVACADQHSIDRGDFLLAGELLLEDAPPVSSFAAHQLPSVWDSHHTKLVDTRWMELIMTKLQNLADYQEKKGKLNPSKKSEDKQPAPKSEAAKPKKPKGKAGGKGGEEKPPADSTS